MTVMSDFVRGMRLPLSPREIPEGESISKGRRTPALVVFAASRAQKAADLILGRSHDTSRYE